MDKLIVTLLVATAGGLLCHQLKIPAGALIGSMVAVALLNIFFSRGFVPKNFQIVVQILAGAMIGTRITKSTILELKTIVVPAIIIVIGVVVINFTIGLLIAKFSKMDLATALFASAPGGQTEMTIAAEAMGADTPKVAVLQLLRLISVVTFLPILLKIFLSHFAK